MKKLISETDGYRVYAAITSVPNPEGYKMLEVTCCTFNVCAIIWPVTVKLPVMLCVALKLFEPVVA